jgi:hypothetical protein
VQWDDEIVISTIKKPFDCRQHGPQKESYYGDGLSHLNVNIEQIELIRLDISDAGPNDDYYKVMCILCRQPQSINFCTCIDDAAENMYN